MSGPEMRRHFRASLVAALALLLSACGGDGSGVGALPEPPASGGETPLVEPPGSRVLRSHNDACAREADASRWETPAVAEAGIDPPFISAHRGANHLAPENTIYAYRHSFAYEADTVEVDVRQTLGGVFVALHDSTLDRTTDGSGELALRSWAQLQSLNAADFAPWKGGEYDPARIPRLEDILELAQAAGKGIEFDVKFVIDYPGLFALVREYEGVMERSFFNMGGFDRAIWGALNPDARFIHNVDDGETAADLHEATAGATVFGSRLDRFGPGQVAAIHDGCGIVVPHSYDRGPEHEAEDFLIGRAFGIDGVQTNQPDLIRAAARSPVATVIADDDGKLCLRNRRNGLGLPQKTLTLDGTRSERTDREGCVASPAVRAEFPGDGSALPGHWSRR